MPAILTFRFPLKSTVKEEDIRLLVNQWIRVSRYYDFKDAVISPDEFESSSHSLREGNIASLHHCQYTDERTDTNYLAFRLSNHDRNNFFWRSDVIFERNSKYHPWLLINHSRSIFNLDNPADCRNRIKYPTIVKLLYDHDMIASDNGLPVNTVQAIRDLSSSQLDMITAIFQNRLRTEFPFLYVYIPGFSYRSDSAIENLFPDDVIDQLLADSKPSVSSVNRDYNFCLLFSLFARICHVYIASTEEEHQKWQLMTAGIPEHTPHFVLSQPELSLDERILINDATDFPEIYHRLILLFQEFQQNIPLNYPAWDTLPKLTSEKSNAPEDEAYYLYMNRRLANAIQKRRKELHLTQGDLANEIQVTKMLISRLERLQTIKVKRSVIQDLEKVLKVNAGTFLRLQGKEEDASPEYETISPQQPAASTARYCRFCGKPILVDSRFCSWCGKEVVVSE